MLTRRTIYLVRKVHGSPSVNENTNNISVPRFTSEVQGSATILHDTVERLISIYLVYSTYLRKTLTYVLMSS